MCDTGDSLTPYFTDDTVCEYWPFVNELVMSPQCFDSPHECNALDTSEKDMHMQCATCVLVLDITFF